MNVKTLRTVRVHARGRPLPRPKLDLPKDALRITRELTETATMPLDDGLPRLMLEYFVYLIYRAGFALLSTLPLRATFALGNALGFCAWLTLGKYRRLGFHNLKIALGDAKSPREMRRLVRRHFQ